MDRRKPGQNPLTTPRKEADEVCVLTGLKNNLITTGKPLKMIIKNTNIRPHDYLPILRPGHAD
jgi:chorismate synthase